MTGVGAEALAAAIKAHDIDALARTLEAHPALKARLDEPAAGAAFGQTALLAAVQSLNRDMIDVLLRAGASINQKSHWWAGGFHALDEAWRAPWLAPFLIERGAVLEIHHAVRLGMDQEADQLLSARPDLIRARGGDGQLPLHFAQTVAMAQFLVERGAEIDARDVDHESTAAQWMVRDRTEVARWLVGRGCATDILMVSALGDAEEAGAILEANPDAIRTAVNSSYFPMRNPHAGGSIYIWTLGANKTAPVLAREFGHQALYNSLMDRAPAGMRLAAACEVGDEPMVTRLVAATPGLGATQLSDGERRKIADAAQDENITAVGLLLRAGWPVDARGQHRATALHWAAFHGNVSLIRMLLAHQAPVNIKGDDYDGTPLEWALHGSQHGWRAGTGDYAGAVEALLAAGAEAPPVTDGRGTPAVIDVLRRHRP